MNGSDESLGIASPQREKLVDRNRQFLLGILAEVSLDQAGSKAVKARLHGSMGRKKVAGTGDGKRDVERLAMVFHVGTRPFQHRECGVTFIEMADLGLQSQGSQEPPASNTEDQLLFQTQLRATAVQFSRNATEGQRDRWYRANTI